MLLIPRTVIVNFLIDLGSYSSIVKISNSVGAIVFKLHFNSGLPESWVCPDVPKAFFLYNQLINGEEFFFAFWARPGAAPARARKYFRVLLKRKPWRHFLLKKIRSRLSSLNLAWKGACCFEFVVESLSLNGERVLSKKSGRDRGFVPFPPPREREEGEGEATDFRAAFLCMFAARLPVGWLWESDAPLRKRIYYEYILPLFFVELLIAAK